MEEQRAQPISGAAGAHVPAPRSERTRIRRHPERGVPERIEEILRGGSIAHVAYVDGGEPRVIPFLYLYEEGHVYLHGSPGSGTMRLLRDGRPVTVSVATIDALVTSKTEMNHSANYHSAVVFGRGHRVSDLEKKRRILRAFGARYFPEREAPRDFSLATDDDLVRTELLAIEIDEGQAKARTGAAMGPGDDDPTIPGSAFIRPI